MTIKRSINAVVHGLIGIVVFFVAGVFLASRFLSIDLVKPYVVQSGSMEPAIKLASVVFSIPQKTYNPGDIITFAPNGNHKNLVTHRIDFKLYPDGIHNEPVYITSGDANDDFDRWETKNEHIVGRAVVSIPYLGYLIDFAKKPQGFILLVIIPATIVIYEELRFLKREMGEPLGKLREKVKRRGLIKRKEEITIRTINLVPKKQKEGIAKASILVPVVGSVLVFISLSTAYFFDLETSLENILGAATSFGEQTATVYDSNPFTCPTGASNTASSFGFAVFEIDNGTLSVDVSLSGATADSSYDIWVNQDPGGCPLASPTAPGALTTDGSGDGVASVDTPLVGGATSFWISAVGGGQVLRSTAVSF